MCCFRFGVCLGGVQWRFLSGCYQKSISVLGACRSAGSLGAPRVGLGVSPRPCGGRLSVPWKPWGRTGCGGRNGGCKSLIGLVRFAERPNLVSARVPSRFKRALLATHFIRQFPLHFPFLASPCAITFQLNSTKGDGAENTIIQFYLYSLLEGPKYYRHDWESSFQNTRALCGDRGSTVIKVLCYKSEGRWFDSSWCQWIFHWHKILPIALWFWGRLGL